MKYSLIVFIFLSLNSFANDSIAQVCGLDKRVEAFETQAQGIQAICDAISPFNNEDLDNLAGESIDILRALNRPGSELNQGHYLVSLDRMSAQLNKISQFNNTNDDSLTAFITKYENPQNRLDQSSYLNDLKNIIEQSEVGKKALDCFYNNDAQVEASIINLVDSSNNNDSTLLGVFNLQKLENGKFKKSISLDLKNSAPSRALTLLTHEMMHACDTENFIAHEHSKDENQAKITSILEARDNKYNQIKDSYTQAFSGSPEELSQDLQNLSEYINFGDDFITDDSFKDKFENFKLDELDKLNSDLSQAYFEQGSLKRLRDQERALGELKVYKQVDIDFYKELATKANSYFCDQYTPSAFIGGLVKYGESRSFMEEGFKNKTILDTIIKQYTVSNGYDPNSFYVDELNENGDRVMATSYETLEARGKDPAFMTRVNEIFENF